mgnify:CR=1 FL=1
MLVRRLARPLLASVFVTGGIDTLRNPKPRAEVAGPLVDRMATAAQPVAQKLAGAVEGHVDQVAAAVDAGAERVADAVPDAAGGERVATVADQATTASADAAQVVHDVARGQALPFETETYVKVNAAVQVGAGLLLATGKFPRAASVALAATLVPTTIAGHPFWELEGDERRTQRTQFLKNAGLLGGLILAAVDTEGRPGVAYRARHARDEAKAAAAAAGLSAALADLGRAASSHGHDLVAAARESDLPDTARAKAHDLLAAARDSELPDTARAKAHDLLAAARDSDLPDVARAKAHDLVATARESDLPKVAAARARELAAEASARADDLSSSAQALGERVAGSVRAA